jgi:hypothetical protein
LPQLKDITAFPTSVFLDRNGRVRRIYAGFHGPAAGPQHAGLVREFDAEIQKLLRQTSRSSP